MTLNKVVNVLFNCVLLFLVSSTILFPILLWLCRIGIIPDNTALHFVCIFVAERLFFVYKWILIVLCASGAIFLIKEKRILGLLWSFVIAAVIYGYLYILNKLFIQTI